MQQTNGAGQAFQVYNYVLEFEALGARWELPASRTFGRGDGTGANVRDSYATTRLGWETGKASAQYGHLVSRWLQSHSAEQRFTREISDSGLLYERVLDSLRAGDRTEDVEAWIGWLFTCELDLLEAASEELDRRERERQLGLGLKRAGAALPAPEQPEPRAVQVGLAACGGARALLAIAEHPSEQVQQVMGQTILLAVRTASLAAFAAGFEAAARQIEQFARATADAVSSAEQVLEATETEQES